MIRWVAVASFGLLAVAMAACNTDERAEMAAAEERVTARLLSVDQFGDGWVDAEAPQPLATKASLDPPCPVDIGPVDFAVDAIAAAELGNEGERVGFSHTVAELSGDPSAPSLVRDAWVVMDCDGADFEVTDFIGLPDGVVGVQFTARSGPLVQVALIRADGDEVAYLIVSGDGDAPIELAQELATEF